ncbi:hypothetical protein UY3_05311 [Chelonia mydas]|uniref:Myb/SANT-like DNA-binding domain-containing protein n=1 Tax=Chelonia mydas TaxID=8469 RepID=M7BZI8_CHEMY|nr:hypothetical protein UY3_05311 [Chelonia mydas]
MQGLAARMKQHHEKCSFSGGSCIEDDERNMSEHAGSSGDSILNIQDSEDYPPSRSPSFSTVSELSANDSDSLTSLPLLPYQQNGFPIQGFGSVVTYANCIWEEKTVQSQLRSGHRNYDTYGQISRCMTERGHDWNTVQCRVKVKELRNVYYKAREANCRSGAAPTSCQVYKELDMILGGDPTYTAKTTVDTSVAHVRVESGPGEEEEILDEDVEGEGDPEAEDDSEV